MCHHYQTNCFICTISIKWHVSSLVICLFWPTVFLLSHTSFTLSEKLARSLILRLSKSNIISKMNKILLTKQRFPYKKYYNRNTTMERIMDKYTTERWQRQVCQIKRKWNQKWINPLGNVNLLWPWFDLQNWLNLTHSMALISINGIM